MTSFVDELFSILYGGSKVTSFSITKLALWIATGIWLSLNQFSRESFNGLRSSVGCIPWLVPCCSSSLVLSLVLLTILRHWIEFPTTSLMLLSSFWQSIRKRLEIKTITNRSYQNYIEMAEIKMKIVLPSSDGIHTVNIARVSHLIDS